MVLTEHALIRSQQRGISNEVIRIVAQHGTMTPRPGGAVGYEVTKRDANQMITDLRRLIHHLERAARVRLIAPSDQPDTIITVYDRNLPGRVQSRARRQNSTPHPLGRGTT